MRQSHLPHQLFMQHARKVEINEKKHVPKSSFEILTTTRKRQKRGGAGPQTLLCKHGNNFGGSVVGAATDHTARFVAKRT